MNTVFKSLEAIIVAILFTSMLLSQDSFEVLSTSIQPNDTVGTHAGLVVTFSDPISIESLQTEEIAFMEYIHSGEYIIDSLRVFIQNASNVTLNNQPLSFWYDIPSHSFAFLQETTTTMPDGTGTGFILDPENVFQLHSVTSESGDSLAGDLIINFIQDDDLHYNVAPNPYYGASDWEQLPPDSSDYDPKILFMHLPITCTISLSTYDGIFLNSIEHIGDISDGVEFFRLRDSEDHVLPSGIYRWSIENEGYESFNHGVLFALLQSVMSISEISGVQPEKFSTIDIFPNPFNGSTNIVFQIPTIQSVDLRVVNINGTKIWGKAYHDLSPGQYSATWHMKNTEGVEVPSGIYFVQIISKTQNATQKVTVLK